MLSCGQVVFYCVVCVMKVSIFVMLYFCVYVVLWILFVVGYVGFVVV